MKDAKECKFISKTRFNELWFLKICFMFKSTRSSIYKVHLMIIYSSLS